MEDVQIRAGKGARRLRQPQYYDRPAPSRQSRRLGIDGLETAETEERAASESGMTNNTIFKGGSGHPFYVAVLDTSLPAGIFQTSRDGSFENKRIGTQPGCSCLR